MFRCDMCKKRVDVVATVQKFREDKKNLCYKCFENDVKVSNGKVEKDESVETTEKT